MSQQPAIALMQGGLDLVAPPIAASPGDLIACENYEPDVQGYTRFAGYERFDGRPKPSDATDAIDREARRAAITEVPGAGGVLCTWRVNDAAGVNSYALRKNSGDAAGTVYQATAGGWVALPLVQCIDFTAAGVGVITPGDGVTGGTSGATATVGRVVLQSGTYSGSDAAGYFELIGGSGTFTPGETITGPAAAWTATAATIGTTPIDLGARSSVRTNSFRTGENYETSYLVTGSTVAFEINGTDVFPIKRAGASAVGITHVAIFSNHLFLGVGTSLIHSAPNDPRDFTAISGASEIGLGSEVQGLQDEIFTSLLVYGSDRISYLTGTSINDFALLPIIRDAAPRPGSMQVAGTAIFADRIGVRRLTTTEAFGSWRVGTLTAAVEPYFRQAFKVGITPVASMRVRDRDLYRLFFSDGSVLSLYFGGENVRVGRLRLAITPSCSWEATGTDTDDVILVGGSDGFVYQFDVGNSEDGAEITAFATFSPYAAGSPRSNKRFKSVFVEMTGNVPGTPSVSAEYDYGDPLRSVSSAMFDPSLSALNPNTLWDLAVWDEASWSAALVYGPIGHLNGSGRNIVLSLRTVSDFEDPHTITALIFNVMTRSVVRRPN